jgi:hypothetical protein
MDDVEQDAVRNRERGRRRASQGRGRSGRAARRARSRLLRRDERVSRRERQPLSVAPAAVVQALGPTPAPDGRTGSRGSVAVPTRRVAELASSTEAVPASSPPELPASRSIGWEIATLDLARRALAVRDVGRALELLDHLDRGSPSENFGPETLLLRIDALRSAGRAEEARTLAGRMLERYPSHPSAARLREFLASP